jgi:hypothetical protein
VRRREILLKRKWNTYMRRAQRAVAKAAKIRRNEGWEDAITAPEKNATEMDRRLSIYE